jgi:hypothetical protein
VGSFVVDPSNPYRREDAPDRYGDLRSVLVFRLKAIDQHPEASPDAQTESPDASGSARMVDPESNIVAEFEVSKRASAIGHRREAELMSRLEDHLRGQGHEVKRWFITPPGQARPLLTDTFDCTTRALHEVKAQADRNSIRMALGQLMDYRRHIECDRCVVVVPVRPADDLVDLIASCGFGLMYPRNLGFESN